MLLVRCSEEDRGRKADWSFGTGLLSAYVSWESGIGLDSLFDFIDSLELYL